MIQCTISIREEDVDGDGDGDAGVEDQEAEEGEEVADAMTISAPTNTVTRMATALTIVMNARLQQRATVTMQLSRT